MGILTSERVPTYIKGLCRNAADNHARRDIHGDDRTRSDNQTLTYSHSKG
jgi:hypothetical protein